MKVMVIGSGGREHAICDAFSRSEGVTQLLCAPGNGGIAQVAKCIDIKADDITRLAEFAESEAIDLTFVGGEGPLALGVVDEFESRGLRIIGASQSAARLESSKAFAKEFMARHGIPTARFNTAHSPKEAIETIESGHFGGATEPVVVKADGLAAGKGVVVARDRAEAVAACSELASLVGADAAAKIVLEEYLAGKEVSLIMFADGTDFALMPPVRDHKRIGEGDTGPNTGGMGTITDANLLTASQLQAIINDIIEPTLKGCIDDGFPFRGILFLGLMMTEGGAKVLEYNVRFGDPETQSILVRLETDLVKICEAMLDGTLKDQRILWREGNSACVVLAAEGYPQQSRTGDPIAGLDAAARIQNVTVLHAGTKQQRQAQGVGGSVSAGSSFPPPSFTTAGGRVLGVTATGATLDEALITAYEAVGCISWVGMQYRRDIGK